jgi:porin
MKRNLFVILLGTALLPCSLLLAQNDSASAPAAKATTTEPPGMENLNLLGADISMPPFPETILGATSEYRRALYSKGFLLRSNSTLMYSQNTLNPPVPADQQVYMGDREFSRGMLNPMLTYDMRDFHLHDAQLYFAAGYNWVSWEPAGPKSLTMSSLYLYKAFANKHIETKLGYIGNDFEFLGLQVGGVLSTGSQGVYAILPYEVGLSHFPLPAPAFNLKLNGPDHLYFKTSIQRSLDPRGGVATIERNETGFRPFPKGDKMVNVFEAGFRQPATAVSHQTWLRTGYIHNSTPYPNNRTGVPTPGNMCAFFLIDRQLIQTDPARPGHGIYTGFSAIGTSTDLNAYTRYYEFRLYDEGPFKSRPGDTAAIVTSHSNYSKYLIANLVADGKTAWRNSTTITGSYNVEFSRGIYLSTGLSFNSGPDITPRVANALTFNAIMNFFF